MNVYGKVCFDVAESMCELQTNLYLFLCSSGATLIRTDVAIFPQQERTVVSAEEEEEEEVRVVMVMASPEAVTYG